MASKQKRFDSLLNALYADVYRYAYWVCQNQGIAEDLVQETYLRAWRSFEQLKDERAAKAWLFTILRRENARRFERIQPDTVDIDEVNLADTRQSPGEHSESMLLQSQIAALDIEYREPLVLQLVGGFSVEEISTILDINKNTALTRLFRARNKLKQALAPHNNRGASNG